MKEVSKMMDLPQSKIRYYDKMGLLPYLKHSDAGYRMFSEGDLTMLRVINCFKSTDMSIQDMQKFIQLVLDGDETLEERYKMFVEQKRLLNQQMQELQKQMDLVEHKLWYYQTAIEAGTEAIHKTKNKDLPCKE